MSSTPCVFCARISAGDITVGNDLAAAFPDGYPISKGHTLIVPVRHEADYFALTEEEQIAILRLTATMRQRLTQAHAPSAFNIGVNAGVDAGQTIGHAHLHLIPRYPGDQPDPRGGVRWIIPGQANYWDRSAE